MTFFQFLIRAAVPETLWICTLAAMTSAVYDGQRSTRSVKVVRWIVVAALFVCFQLIIAAGSRFR